MMDREYLHLICNRRDTLLGVSNDTKSCWHNQLSCPSREGFGQARAAPLVQLRLTQGSTRCWIHHRRSRLYWICSPNCWSTAAVALISNTVSTRIYYVWYVLTIAFKPIRSNSFKQRYDTGNNISRLEQYRWAATGIPIPWIGRQPESRQACECTKSRRVFQYI